MLKLEKLLLCSASIGSSIDKRFFLFPDMMLSLTSGKIPSLITFTSNLQSSYGHADKHLHFAAVQVLLRAFISKVI